MYDSAVIRCFLPFILFVRTGTKQNYGCPGASIGIKVSDIKSEAIERHAPAGTQTSGHTSNCGGRKADSLSEFAEVCS